MGVDDDVMDERSWFPSLSELSTCIVVVVVDFVMVSVIGIFSLLDVVSSVDSVSV